jgi:hypothetical protein
MVRRLSNRRTRNTSTTGYRPLKADWFELRNQKVSGAAVAAMSLFASGMFPRGQAKDDSYGQHGQLKAGLGNGRAGTGGSTASRAAILIPGAAEGVVLSVAAGATLDKEGDHGLSRLINVVHSLRDSAI